MNVIQQAIEALQGVIRVADRATVEFDAAKAALASLRAAQEGDLPPLLTDERIERIAKTIPLEGCDRQTMGWGIGYSKESDFFEPNIPKVAFLFARAIESEVRLALAAAGGGVPPGWKLVPVEPTAEMWAAVNKLDDEMAAGGYDGKGCTIEQAWECLLASSPQPEAAQEQPEKCGNRDYCGRFPFCGCGGPEPLPERDTSKPAEQQGLFRKFDVRRTDGSDKPGGKHYGCEYFVLDVAHDKHARAALAAYARGVEPTHPELASDMRDRYELPSTNEPEQAAQGQGEREAFEDWVFDCERQQPMTWDKECAKFGQETPEHKRGMYYFNWHQRMWEAWQARAALSAAPARAAPTCMCGQPWILNTVHRENSPCWRAADPVGGLGITKKEG